MKKIAAVVTNVDRFAGHDEPTGLWLSELTHFWDVVAKAGYAVDLISPKGGLSPLEPKSLKFPVIDEATKAHLHDPAFMARLNETIPAAQARAEDYAAIYFAGGHGAMYDFPDDAELQRLTREIWEQGGVVSAVCHGYCGLLNVKLSDGSLLIADKALTGFAWKEELVAMVGDKVPYNVQEEVEKRGAKYDCALIPFMSHIERDGRLITGQNPASAEKTAERVVEALKGGAA